jgi:hypothetical protein
MVRAIHRHCGLGQSVPVTGRLSDSLVRSPFDSRDDGVDSSYQPRPPLKAESCAGVHVLGSHLIDIHGVGPVGAARILADVGDAARVRRPEALWVLVMTGTHRSTHHGWPGRQMKAGRGAA